MEKEHAVYERLERIDGLRREDAPADVLLDEVRALLAEAEDWVGTEPGIPPQAADAVKRTKAMLESSTLLPLR